jgi:hypothetical protein
MRVIRLLCLALGFAALMAASGTARAEMTDMPVVKLQSLDKISARTMIFEARVGSTVKFGSLFIKTQACRKASPLDEPESAAFLQIWEVTARNPDPHWVFSGWMFASSPALSSMDHPVYDVWVLDCLERKTGEAPPPAAKTAPAMEKDKSEEKAGERAGDKPAAKSLASKSDAKAENGKKTKKKTPDTETDAGPKQDESPQGTEAEPDAVPEPDTEPQQ